MTVDQLEVCLVQSLPEFVTNQRIFWCPLGSGTVCYTTCPVQTTMAGHSGKFQFCLHGVDGFFY